MARNPNVHALQIMETPVMGWTPARVLSFTDEEQTKKVPDYLVALASELDKETDEDQTDLSMPPCGVASSHLAGLERLDSSELLDVFDSIDRLESVKPPPSSMAVPCQSGIVPACRSAEKLEVIPPPPRAPSAIKTLVQSPPPPASFGSAATLDGAVYASLEIVSAQAAPFQAEAANEITAEDVAVALVASPAAAPVRATVTARQNVSRSVASAVLALFALMVLVIIAERPSAIIKPNARNLVTINARAPMSASRSAARPHAARVEPTQIATPLATAATPVAPRVLFAANNARFSGVRSGTAKGPGRIIRTSPF